MQVLTVAAGALESDRVRNLVPGERYLISEQVVRELRQNEADTGHTLIESLVPFERKNWQFGQDATSLLVWNTGGLGDQLYMTALVKTIKKWKPRLAIDYVATNSAENALWLHNKDIRALRSQFLPLSLIECYDAYFFVDEDIVNLTGIDQPNCYEFIYRMAGFDYYDEQPFIQLSKLDEIRAFTKVVGLKPGDKGHMPANFVVLGLHASARSRNISKEQWVEIAEGLAGLGKDVEGFTIYSLANNEIGYETQLALNAAVPCHLPLYANLYIREIAALVRQAMVVISVDSMVVHLAAAVNAPCVAIMTTVPPQARVKSYPLTAGLWAKGACPFQGCSWKGDTFQTVIGELSVVAPCFTSTRKACSIGAAIKANHVLSAAQWAIEQKQALDDYQLPELPYIND
jgi:ADP-heptose:LPS heptosyltransferase